MMESPFKENTTIAEINFKLAFAVFLIAMGYWIWPSDPRWYAFYAMAVILYLASAGLVFNALRLMRQLQISRKKWKEFEKRGNAPKNARLATKNDLAARGMK